MSDHLHPMTRARLGLRLTLLALITLGASACGSADTTNPCTSTPQQDGSVVVQCGDGAPVTVRAATSTPCVEMAQSDGTTTIMCPDGTSSTVRPGASGADGVDGANGADGADGSNGTDGADGADGADAPGPLPLMNVLLADAADCPHGGYVLQTGVDDGDGGGTADNGTLEAGEVDTTSAICTGADGVDGADGSNGADGVDGVAMLGAIYQELPGPTCAEGGQRIEQGLDVDGDGALDASEIDASRSQVVCGQCGSSPLRAWGVSANLSHTCALIGLGRVACWGRNDDGQLGDGTTTDTPLPVAVQGLAPARAVSVGWDHTCALLETGEVACWGYNNDGQLGDNTRVSRPTPALVQGLAGVVQLSAGRATTCAVLATGGVKCWGYGQTGMIGDGSTARRLTPTDVLGITDAASVHVGSFHTCARLRSGSVKCWGTGVQGRLGDGVSTGNTPTPVTVANLTDAVSVDVGLAHTCAARQTGEVVCWGGNQSGACGDADPNVTEHLTPFTVPGLTSAREISAGGRFSCALLDTGRLKCWGVNLYNQLGNNDTQDSATPVDVVGVEGAAHISARGGYACSERDGVLSCWGFNSYGQLGRPVPAVNTPNSVKHVNSCS